ATATLTPTVTDAAGATITPTPSLVWSTSAATVATVSQAGVVTAIAPGNATITAQTANGTQGTASVTVTNAAVPATIVLSPGSVAVPQGGTQGITAVVRDAAGNQITPTPPLTWQSSNPGVATVSAAGVVTGVADGFATITARTANNVTATVSVTVGASGSFTARVYEFETNQAVAGASVTVSVPAGTVRTVTTDAQGNFNTGTLFGGPFSLRVVAAGFASADVRNLVLNGARTLEAIPLARTTANGSGSISGTLYNATTDTPILAVGTLELFAGVNSQDGSPIATTNSSQGNYRFSFIPAGTYTVRARANGFSTSTRTVVSVGGGRDAAGQHIQLSPTSTIGSLRIVLTWGSSPADLDAHLTGPSVNASTFWIYFNSPGSCTTAPFACLDVDAIDGRGPETITIAQRMAGRYVYSVHNFSASDSGSIGSLGLAQSNARVDVYGPSGLITSFAPPARAGTLWTVFDWDGTTIRPINTVSDQPPPGADRLPVSLDAAAQPSVRMPLQKPKRKPPP
ncbi:MAG: carboxypeptidase regulatory-like domain-containing protein, partial [Gemmatimonas sp.]